MKRVLQIVDSYDYVSTNSFQHQLLKTLQQETDLLTVAVDQLRNTAIDGRIVFICLKLRSTVKHLELLYECIGDVPVYIWDQDPWESFMDEGSYRGSYKHIQSKLNVASFVNPSKYWSERASFEGSPSSFGKIWILPEYCSIKPLEERSTDIGFMGQLHPFRKQTFERLRELSFEVETFPGSTYGAYLEKVSDMKFFVHYEPDRWHINGTIVPCHGLYGKTVEVMSRGTFCLRERCDESVYWNLRDNPLMIEFSSLEELVQNVNHIKSLDPEQIESKMKTGVEMIQADIGWKSVVEVLK